MKTKELKKIARENGYKISDDDVTLSLIRENCVSKNEIDISKVCVNRIWIKNGSYVRNSDVSVMEAAIKCAKTPPEDREERFYLKHKWVSSGDGSRENYLNKTYPNEARDEASVIYFISTKNELSLIRTKFTQAEIDEIKSRLDTNLEDFEQVEVEE